MDVLLQKETVPAILLRANNASPWTGPTGCNTFLFRGAVPALVDAGAGQESHINAVANTLAEKVLQILFVTHEDPDHNGGVADIQWKWQNIRVVRYGELGAEAIPAGDTYLRPLHTPGHAPDHLCFLDEREGELYCGDLLRAGGTVVIPASQGGDLAQYLDSLRRLRALRLRRIYPGHGPVIDDAAGIIDEYLRHRARREIQIMDALRAGDRTPETIVARVYGRLAPVIAAAAADTVLAHLVKLRNEGKVTGAPIPSEGKGVRPETMPWAWHLA
jgi:glyoxylase-like metal-dependent hydrolase (beta-lactamase superfamily II)